MQEFVALANRLADAAGEIVKQYYRQPFEVETKGDDSPVTIADRAIEQRMREMIEAERPQDGILGEEFGVKDGTNGLTWVLDPIDGTKSFVIGRPTFGTLIALCDGGLPKLGVIDQAILGERWVGVNGEQTLFNGKAVKCAPCPSLEAARIGSTTPAMFEKVGPVYQKFNEGRFFWGGDCYQYGLMACGFVDVILEAGLSPYDYAALVPVVQGAGGHMSDFAGRALTLESDGTVLAVGDKALVDEALEVLG
ncbi:MAG: inositol monophosphatase family protein [Alphaproteobacteria bacterium]